MHKFLLLYLIFQFYSEILPAQNFHDRAITPVNSHEYYIRIRGIDTRQKIVNIENNISHKPGVTFFMANRYPVRYFLMRSDYPVSVHEFSFFLSDPSHWIEYYGEGKKSREHAVLLYNKTKAR